MSVRVGQVVVSRAGRDKGRGFLVAGELPGGYVHIVDGSLRKLAHPKKKKLRHLKVEAYVAEALAEKMASGTEALDAEIRRTLANLGYGQEQQEEG